ncbi:MAG: hypothetical protein RL616_2295 [Verrucomicrobiota bacterium]|jgi:hypothetical protein
MKTPREVLLAHHQAAAPKLDAIRQSTVAAMTGHRSTANSTATTTLFQTLWQELILPSRRLWSGLATVWLLILAVNLAQHDPSSADKMVASAPAMMSFREQQRWMTELFADRSMPVEAEPPKTFSPKPRTEKFQTFNV